MVGTWPAALQPWGHAFWSGLPWFVGPLFRHVQAMDVAIYYWMLLYYASYINVFFGP